MKNTLRMTAYRSTAITLAMFAIMLFSRTASAQQWITASTGGAWLSTGNWSPGAVPIASSIAQFDVNPTGAGQVGLNLNGSTNNGAHNQIVGAINVSGARTVSLTIGNSSTSASGDGILTLAGATITSTSNVIIANTASNPSASILNLTNISSGGNRSMGVDIQSTATTKTIITGGGSSALLAGNTISISSNMIGSNPLFFNGGGAYTGTGNAGGILLLSGNNISLTGAITVGSSITTTQSGVLNVSGLNALAGTSSLTINAFSQLYLATAGTYAFASGGTVTLNGAGNGMTAYGPGAIKSVATAIWPSNVVIPSATTISAGANLSLTGVATGAGNVSKIGAGTLAFSGPASNLTGSLNISVGSIALPIASGGATTLAIGTGGITFAATGTGLSTAGIAASGAVITGGALTISTGTVSITLDQSVAHTINFAASPSVVWGATTTLNIYGWQGTNGSAGTVGRIFIGSDPTATNNLSATNLGKIFFVDGGGASIAATMINGELVPSTAGTFYSKSTGDLNTLATWGANTDGSGANPANFTAAAQFFNISNNNPGTMSATPWTVSGTGSKIIISGSDLTITSGTSISGTVSINAGRTLTITNSSATSLSTLTLSGLSPTSTVIYKNGVSNAFSTTTYGNIIYDGAGTGVTTAAAALSFAGDFTVRNSAVFNGSTITLTPKSLVAQTITGTAISLGGLTTTAANKLGTLTLASGTNITLTTLNLDHTGSANRFNDGGNAILLKGSATLAGDAAGYNFTGSLNSTPGVAATIAGTAPAVFNNVNVTAIGFTPTFNATNGNFINGDFIVTGTTTSLVSLGTTTTLNGNLSVAAGSTGSLTLGTLNIAKDFTWSPTTDRITTANANVNFNGSIAQTYSTAVVAGNSFLSTTLSNPVGLTLNGKLTSPTFTWTGAGSLTMLPGTSVTLGTNNTLLVSTLFTGATASPKVFLGGGTWNDAVGTGNTGGLFRITGAGTSLSGGMIVGNSTTASGTYSSGVLEWASPGPWSNVSGNDITINPNSSLVISSGTTSTLSAFGVTLNGHGNPNFSGTTYGIGALHSNINETFGGDVTLASAATIYVVSGTSLTLLGNTAFTGQLTKRGAGTLILAGTANTGTAGLTMSEGILSVGTTTTASSLSAVAGCPVSFVQPSTVTTGGTLNFVNGSQTITSLSSSWSGTTVATNTLSIATGVTVTLNQSTSTTFGDNGSTNTKSIISGAGTLAFSGTGTLTLNSGSHAHSGALNVTNGNLIIAPTATASTIGTAGVTLNGGATISLTPSFPVVFGSTGGVTIGGSVTLSSLIVSGSATTNTLGAVNLNANSLLKILPSAGTTLTMGAVASNTGAISTVGITSPSSLIVTAGALNVTGSSTITLDPATIHSIKFAASPATWTNTLTIYGWQGTYSGVTGTKGHVFFGTTAGLSVGNLALVKFNDGSGNTFDAIQLATGEVVPKASTITTTFVPSSTYSNAANIPVNVTYTYTGPITGNVTAELSDRTGTFPGTSIGTATVTAGTIAATIPSLTPGGTYKIRVTASTPVSVIGTSTGNFIIGGSYYSAASGNLDAVGTWWSNSDGATGVNPANFTTAEQTFRIINSHAGTIGGTTWTVSGSNSKIVVDAANPTFNKIIVGPLSVSAGNTISLQSATAVTFGTLDVSSTVVYNNAATANTFNSGVTYGNIVFDGTTGTSATAQTLNFAGNFTLRNAASFVYTGTSLVTKGTTDQTITGNGLTFTVSALNNTAANKSGKLILATSTPMTITTVTMDNTGTANRFEDGGNTVTVKGSSSMTGNAAGYLLTGTLSVVPAAATTFQGATNAAPLAAALNNVNISTAQVVTFFPAGTTPTVISGNLNVTAATSTITLNTVNLAGDYTWTPTTNNMSTISVVNFNGAVQSYSTNVVAGLNFGGISINNTSLTNNNRLNTGTFAWTGGNLITAPGASSTVIGAIYSVTGVFSGAATKTFLGGGTWNGTSGVGGGLLKLAGASGTSTNGITVGSSTSITSSGVLDLANLTAWNDVSGNNIVVNPFSQLCLTAAGSYTASNVGVTLNGTGNNIAATYGLGALRGTANANWNSAVTLATDATVAMAAGTTLTLSGLVTYTGQMTKRGTGVLSLSGASNTGTGGLKISEGAVNVASGSSFGNGPLEFAEVVSTAGTLTLNSAQTVSSLSSSWTNTAAVTHVLNLAAGSSLTVNQSGNTEFGGNGNTSRKSTITGNGAFIKTGSGILSLTSSATNHTGSLTLAGGELNISPSASITLGNSTTLGGVVISGTATTLSTSGITASATVTLGAFTLSADATVSLSTSVAHSLRFATSTGTWGTNTLTIQGWQGDYNGNSGTAGKLYFGATNAGLGATNLGKIKFVNGAYTYDAFQRTDGEVVPKASITSTTLTPSGPYYNDVDNNITIDYTYTGPVVAPGTTYTAQISDITGSYLGTLIATATGTVSPIAITIPSLTPVGTYKIRVITSTPLPIFGNDLSISIVGHPPVLTSVSSYTNAVPGTIITLTGTNFNTVAASNNKIFFGPVSVTANHSTLTTLDVTVPAGATLDNLTLTDITTHLSANSPKPFVPDYTNDYFKPGISTQTAVTFSSVRSTPWNTAVGDLDGDGDLDIVIVNGNATSYLTVYRNDAPIGGSVDINSGSFVWVRDIVLPAVATTVKIADIDGDGKPDVVTSSVASTTVSLLRNSTTLFGTVSPGAINFETRREVTFNTSAANTQKINIEDYDKDGKLDIAGSAYGSTGGTNESRLVLIRNSSIPGTAFGNNNIYFDTTTFTSDNNTAASGSSLCSGDFNGDGKIDIAMVNQNTTANGTVTVFGNNCTVGSMSFVNQATLNSGRTTADIATADVDGDGWLDLVVTDQVSSHIGVYINPANNTYAFPSSPTYSLPGTADTYPAGLALADIDGDGRVDIVAVNANNSGSPGIHITSDTVMVFLNTTTLSGVSFASPTLIHTGGVSAGAGVIVADIDRDKYPDMIIANITDNTISVIRNKPTLNMGVINGTASFCHSSTTTLSYSTAGIANPAGVTPAYADNPVPADLGYTWSSADDGVASVDVAGNVYGVGQGPTSIIYSLTVTGTNLSDTVMKDVTVNFVDMAVSNFPSVCYSDTTGTLIYSAVTGTPSPNIYSITYDATALSAGFQNAIDSVLHPATIDVHVPLSAGVGIYSGDLTVSNGICVSDPIAYSVVVSTPPQAGIVTSDSTPCFNHLSTVDFHGTATDTIKYTVDGGLTIAHTLNPDTAFSLILDHVTANHNYVLVSINDGFCTITYNDTVTVAPIKMAWVGGTSTDWNNMTNWTCGIVPSDSDVVHVPVTVNIPHIYASSTGVAASVLLDSNGRVVLDANATLTTDSVYVDTSANLILAAGAIANSGIITLTSGAAVSLVGTAAINATAATFATGATPVLDSNSFFNVSGALSNNGNVIGEGAVVLNGSSPQTISGKGYINNLTLNNTTGATIATGSNTYIRSTLTLTLGALTTNDSLVLYSDSSGSGRIAEVPASGASIVGKVRVNQWIQANYRRFRFWSHPFSSDISLGQLQPYMDITGTGGATNGFTTTTTNAPSCFWLDPLTSNDTVAYDPGWKPFTQINGAETGNNKFKVHEGIRLFMRGAKDEGLNGYAYVPSQNVVSMIGNVNTGDQTITLSMGSTVPGHQNLNQIGNPYPSPINLGPALFAQSTEVTGAFYYVWNASNGTFGGYEFVARDGSDYFIQANASYQVRAAYNGAHLTYTESMKTDKPTVYLFKPTVNQSMFLNVYDNNYHFWDKLILKFNDDATDNDDLKYDGIKPTGADFNFYSISADNHRMGADVRPFVADKIIPLGISCPITQEFIFKAENVGIVPNGGVLYLHDKLLGKSIALSEGTEYKFTVTADKATQGNNRFELGMKPAQEIAKQGLQVTMAPNPATDDVKVSFTAAKSENASIRVTDMTGITVYSSDLGAKQTGAVIVPMTKFASGIYIVELTVGNEKTVQKLVKE